MSSVCQGFVQNAWKKDFCSNCFKSKDEHTENGTHKSSYFSSPFQSKSNFLSKSIKSSPSSILKLSSKKKHKRVVSFSQDVCQVIGYGGDMWSDDEDFELSEDTEDDDFIPDCEEEKELKSLTKSNTDFNSVKANLLSSNSNGETKKSYTSLLLGKIQTDSDGKKKTLLVSVTPFGQENSIKNSIAKLNDKKSSPIPSIHKNKENKSSDYKTNIILKSFVQNCDAIVNNNCRKDSDVSSEKSLLEEISETLEKNRINCVNNKPNENGDNKKTFEKIDIFEYKKNALNRNAPIKKDAEKPKLNTLAKPEFTFCKIDIEPEKNSSNNELDHEIITKDYSADTISKSMTSDEDSFSSKSDSDSDDRQFMENLNISKKNDDCLKIQVYSENKDSDSDDKTSSDISLDDIRKVDGQSDSLQDTYETHFQSQILDMPSIIPNIGQNVFSAEASRELAGEPDGRADPEETSEPPALPRSPPPQIDPRPSFLHGLIKDSGICRPVVPEKPKLPVKPLSVIKQVNKRPQANVLPQQQVILQLQQTLNNNANSKVMNSSDNLSSKDDSKTNEVMESNDNSIYEETECDDTQKMISIKEENSSSINLTPNKRKAPKPPPSTNEESPGNLYQRNPTANLKSDSPVVREKEKRERASSCSPKFRQNINQNPCGEVVQVVEKTPEPAPRRSLSLSHDNLIGSDDKKKGKLKFSLRKLLRLGSSKDLDKKDLNIDFDPKIVKKDDFCESTPRPKPRLVIIHPLELNGSSVEVVKNNADILNITKQMNNDDLSLSDGSTYSCSSVGDNEDSGYRDIHNKPPPPPRKPNEEEVHTIDGCPTKPARPPPPKSALLLRQQKQPMWSAPPSRPVDNVYANLGIVIVLMHLKFLIIFVFHFYVN